MHDEEEASVGDRLTSEGSRSPILSVRGLRKAFGGVRAVDGVSFDLPPRQVCALIGPNGAGKTTCFNVLTGQLAPDAGVVRLGDERISGRPPRAIWRLGVSRTFQIAATFATLTALENVQVARLSEGGRTFDLFRPVRHIEVDRAMELLAQVGLGGEARRLAGALAYGDVKRLELAIALANDPVLLLLDEPTAGMAPRDRGDLMRLVVAVARVRGLTVLFTEHDMDIVFGAADRVLVLDQGRIIADGEPHQVRADRTVQAVYLGED
jgi:branched-chain amino acid transport system ATP-binding protein